MPLSGVWAIVCPLPTVASTAQVAMRAMVSPTALGTKAIMSS